MREAWLQVFRARFSAITAPEIRAAMSNLGEPNRNEALAVDARQELDLKVNSRVPCWGRLPPLPMATRCKHTISNGNN